MSFAYQTLLGPQENILFPYAITQIAACLYNNCRGSNIDRKVVSLFIDKGINRSQKWLTQKYLSTSKNLFYHIDNILKDHSLTQVNV